MPWNNGFVRFAVPRSVADVPSVGDDTGEDYLFCAESFEIIHKSVYIFLGVAAFYVRQATEDRSFGNVRRDNICFCAKGAESISHFFAHAVVEPAEVAHYGIDYLHGVFIGDEIKDFFYDFALRGGDHVAGVDSVEVYILFFPVLSHGEHIVGKVTNGIVLEHRCVGGQHRGRHAGAFNAGCGNNGQGNSERALADA